MIQELRLAEMLCTRLCHDLAGPVGAVNNGAEFLSEDPGMAEQAADLIISSARQAVARLVFYRNVFGRVNGGGEASIADLKQLANNFFQDTRVTLDWPDAHTDASGVSLSRRMGRLVLNVLCISAETLIKGGTVSVRLAHSADIHKEVVIRATGPAVKFDSEREKVLRGDVNPETLDPKNSDLFLAHLLMKDLQASFTVRYTEDSFEFSIEKTNAPT